MKSQSHLKNIVILLALGYVFLMLGNGMLSLTNPDEVFYSQTAREMKQQGSWMTPYLFGQPQFEKPIMTYWFLRLAFEAGGAGPFAARFFPAFFGMIGVLAVYLLGWLGFRDQRKAFLSAVILLSCGLYVGLSRTVFTDLIFTVFILLSSLAFFWGYAVEKRRQAGWVLFFAFCAMAVLTKGPLGLIIPFCAVLAFLLARREIAVLKGWGFPLGIAVFGLLALPWYIFMIKTYGTVFTREFFVNDHWRRVVEAEHPAADTWYYYPLTTIGSMFPWSVFFISAAVWLVRTFRRRSNPFFLYLICWTVVTFIIFQSAHSKLTSYIFPYFPALALITGFFFVEAEQKKWPRVLRAGMIATGVFCFGFPVGLVVAVKIVPEYVSQPLPVLIFAAFLAVYLAVFLVFAWRRRFVPGFWMLAAFLPVLLAFSLWMTPHFESYVSSRKAGQYLKERGPASDVILCSKFFARGIRFYTDKTIAVLDINGSGYFSPHPVEYINTVDKLQSFLKRQPVTTAVLRKDYVEDLGRLIGDAYSHIVLYQAGDEYIVRILPKQAGLTGV